MKFHIIIFGCQMNYSDSARIKAVLINSGHTYTENIQEADVVIFDTCSVRQKSEDKVTGKLQEINPDQKIWITGCMIQHNFRNKKIANEGSNKKINGLMERGNFITNVIGDKPEIIGFSNEEIENLSKSTYKKKLPEYVYINHAFNPMFHRLYSKHPNIELFFRIDDTGFLPLMMEKLGYKVHPDTEVYNEYMGIIPKGSNSNMDEDSKSVFIPISKGCSQFCAFCIVPYARGLEKHLDPESIIQEAKHHILQGAQEITLLGQIVNKHPQFTYICKEILKIPGLKRLRYTSPYPTYYSDELLELHEKEEKMCPHIHMPLQSGSDIILKKMFRGYNSDQFKEFVDKIRKLKRKISITTDIIVGFCDETEEDFQKTLEITKYSRFDMIYIGKYSTRSGTYAHRKYTDTVSRKEKQDRRLRLNQLLIDISSQNNKEEEQQTKEVMINQIDLANKIANGYTDNMKNIIIENIDSKIKAGEFTKIKITKSIPFKLYGRQI